MRKLLFFNMLWMLVFLHSCCFEENGTHASKQTNPKMTIDTTKNADKILFTDSASGSIPDTIHIEKDTIKNNHTIKHGGPDQDIIDSIKRVKNKRKKK